MLHSQPQYAHRVTVDTVSSSNLTLAAEDVRRILQARLRAIVDDTAVLTAQALADAPGAWTYLYHYAPADETGDVLLLPQLTAGNSVTVRQIKPLSGALQTGADADALFVGHSVLPSPENPCYILLTDIPAGDYQLDVVQETPTAEPPVLKAYKVIPQRSVTLALAADDSADPAAVCLYRDFSDGVSAHTITVETDATDVPADQWKVEF